MNDEVIVCHLKEKPLNRPETFIFKVASDDGEIFFNEVYAEFKITEAIKKISEFTEKIEWTPYITDRLLRYGLNTTEALRILREGKVCLCEVTSTKKEMMVEMEMNFK